MRVAVTGIGAVSAFGWGTDRLRDGLLSGASAATTLTVFDPEGHRTRIAAQVPGRGPDERARVKSERFAAFAVAEALGQAGLSPLPPDSGVFFGSTTGGMLETESFYRRLRDRPDRIVPTWPIASQQNNAPADHVARRFGVRGPVVTIGSACAAGSMALECALDALRSGEIEAAIAGGADELCRLTYAGFNSLRAVDAEPSRPFRAERRGLTMGEGAAALVLEPLEKARTRGATILAELAGTASTCDAGHMTAPAEDGRGAAEAIRRALEDAGVVPDEVAFINAHGTGTRHNDPAETAAFAAVFGERLARIPVTSSKAAIGHLLGASGAIEAVATVVGLARREVHPTAGSGPPDPELPVDLVTGRARALADPVAALSTSLGFGGANAAVVFRSVP
ncbi:MAG: beta-ketoacyl-[acyl-carrier-protein] synthase family protein [Planctomycetota bacterium]|jgi:3-oxoacyl-[acyl-carrier-protein] synthase II